jgi:hypothetical protein
VNYNFKDCTYDDWTHKWTIAVFPTSGEANFLPTAISDLEIGLLEIKTLSFYDYIVDIDKALLDALKNAGGDSRIHYSAELADGKSLPSFI